MVLTVKDPSQPPSQPWGAGICVILHDVKEDKWNDDGIKCKWKRICNLTWNWHPTGLNSEEGSGLIMHVPITGSGEIITGHRNGSRQGQKQLVIATAVLFIRVIYESSGLPWAAAAPPELPHSRRGGNGPISTVMQGACLSRREPAREQARRECHPLLR